MTPLIQFRRRLHYLFIALLLACFVITENGAMGQQPREKQPNQWVIPINIKKPLQCAGGEVTLHANLVVTFMNVPEFEVVTRPPLKLEGFRGTAVSGARKLEVKQQDVKFLPFFNVDTGLREGKFGIEFKVSGPGLPGGAPLRFRVTLSPIAYKFRDGKVTKIIPDDTPVVRCSN